MNLEKAKRISRVLMSCLTVLSILILGAVILFASASALIWLLPTMADKINPYHADMQIQGMNLLLETETFSIPAVSGGALLMAVKMTALFLAVFYSRRIFKCIRFGETPFQTRVAKEIRLIGIFLMVYQFVWSWEDGLMQILLSLMIPSILFCISFIFEYGCTLQKEIDETL